MEAFLKKKNVNFLFQTNVQKMEKGLVYYLPQLLLKNN